ncbi:MAG TPA: glycosyltransferase family 2 protein [Gemmataceae bacterium]|nr:glycosyltransferase family 2 protein [Gemmataceae bacterium]
MTLSVCLLTRNEEKNIARALRSVRGVADQVIVADTGSSDRTVPIAIELGAEICHVAWQDDFAAGRDTALARARSDWILWLNPDEELLATSESEVRACLGRQEAFGYYVIVHELVEADQPHNYSETTQLRLFRRRPQLRSQGRLHPSFVPPLEELAEHEGKRLYVTEIRLQRHAYLSQLTEAKLRWAARLLELELRDRPGQLHYLIQYGRTLLLLNDPTAHVVLAEAVEQLLPLRSAPAAPLPEVQRLLEYELTVSPEQSRSRLTREEACNLAQRWFPYSPAMLWRIGEYYFQRNDFRRAAEFLERLDECRRTGVYDRSESFDPAILGELVVLNLGVCYTRLSQLDKAERCFLSLLENPTFRDRAAQNLALVQSMRGQSTNMN